MGNSDTSSGDGESDDRFEFDLTRRRFLAGVALSGTGGYLAASGRKRWCHTQLPPEMGTGETQFWLGEDSTLQSRPLYSLSLPGTHHASFSSMTDNDLRFGLLTDGLVSRFTRPQSNPVETQLADGIRYLDVRPRYDPDGDHQFWGHHELARGDPLSELFEAVASFLSRADREAAGNELVFIKLSHFDRFDTEIWERFTDLLEEHLGPYALSLPDHEPERLLSRSLDSFDGSRVGLFYTHDKGGTAGDGPNPWPGVADQRVRWLRDGWLEESHPDDVHDAALAHTHTDRTRLGEIGYYLTPTTGGIAAGTLTGWLPFSSRWLAYESLSDAAAQLAERFPS